MSENEQPLAEETPDFIGDMLRAAVGVLRILAIIGSMVFVAAGGFIAYEFFGFVRDLIATPDGIVREWHGVMVSHQTPVPVDDEESAIPPYPPMGAVPPLPGAPAPEISDETPVPVDDKEIAIPPYGSMGADPPLPGDPAPEIPDETKAPVDVEESVIPPYPPMGAVPPLPGDPAPEIPGEAQAPPANESEVAAPEDKPAPPPETSEAKPAVEPVVKPVVEPVVDPERRRGPATRVTPSNPWLEGAERLLDRLENAEFGWFAGMCFLVVFCWILGKVPALILTTGTKMLVDLFKVGGER